MLARLSLAGVFFALVSSWLPAHAQTVPTLVAGEEIPLDRRVCLSQDIPYRIAGTTVTLEVGGIIQLHLEGDGWSSSATLSLSDGPDHAELSCNTNDQTPVAQRTWNGLQLTVFVIHHTGGIELRISRIRP